MQSELLFRKPQTSLRVGSGELELTAMGGDRRDRHMNPRHIEAVLEIELVVAIGIRSRELPAARRKLDVGQPPQHIRRQQLVAVLPFLVLALQDRPGLIDAPPHLEHLRDRCSSPVQQPRIAGRQRNVLCSCGVGRRLGIADGAAEKREEGHRVDKERVVPELVGDLECRAGVLECSDEPLLEAGQPTRAGTG